MCVCVCVCVCVWKHCEHEIPLVAAPSLSFVYTHPPPTPPPPPPHTPSHGLDHRTTGRVEADSKASQKWYAGRALARSLTHVKRSHCHRAGHQSCMGQGRHKHCFLTQQPLSPSTSSTPPPFWGVGVGVGARSHRRDIYCGPVSTHVGCGIPL